MTKEYMGEWKYIPENAFRYFPQGQEVIVGSGDKQWRKIFQGGELYNSFETKALDDLEAIQNKQNIVIDSWFDEANRLRFLQANKFKIEKTIESMAETTKWRASSYPVQIDSQVSALLNSGALYFCGRDDAYRPILVVDIGKFSKGAEEGDSIQNTLVVIMEFMINELLIEGQVENYVLIMNLQEATFALRGIIMKILSFTSNAYRGRLFVSYILSMPTVIRWGWDAIVSKFVSQNTLKKLKVTGDSYHGDMWSHMSKDTVQVQYKGKLPQIKAPFWPPSVERMTYTDHAREPRNSLVTIDEYNTYYHQNKLVARKILKKYITIQETPRNRGSESRVRRASLGGPVLSIRDYEEQTHHHLIGEEGIKLQTHFEKDTRIIMTFFQSDSFRRICRRPVVTQ